MASAPPRFRLATLGELRLDGPDGELLAGRRKELVLLAFLARRAPRPVPREELAALLWGDRESARARQSLRNALLQLRRAVGDAIEVTPERARVDPGLLELDVTAFERDIAEGRLREAVARWRGEFVAGAEDSGGESFRAWVEGEREGLARRLTTAFDRLVVEALRRGQSSEGVAQALEWTDALPFDEQAHSRLVEALKAAGRPDEALARHATVVARLRDELGRDPSPAFMALADGLARAASRPRPAGPSSAALLAPDLVGREAALAELISAWYEARAGRATAVFVSGNQGFGKSRLCQEFVRWVRADDTESCVLTGQTSTDDRDTRWSAARQLLAGLADAPGLLGASPAALHTAARFVPAIANDLASGPSGLAPPEMDDTQTSAALCEVIEAVAGEVPVLVVLDDAPLADASTQQFLAALLKRPVPGVMLVMTGSANALSAVLGDVVRQSRSVRRLQLQPLDPTDTEALVASMVAIDTDDRRRLATRLHADTGGNPLHITELVFSLAEDGTLALGPDGRWRVDPAVLERPLPAPASVRGAEPARPPTSTAEQRERRGPRRTRTTLVWTTTAALSVAAIIWVWTRSRPDVRSAPAAPVRFTLAVPPTERVKTEVPFPLAFSPDGRFIAYVLYGGRVGTGRGAVYLRVLDQLRATPIPGTEGLPFAPFFSPDGRWIAFMDGGTALKKVPVAGGEVVTVATAPAGARIFAGTWGANDEIVVASDRGLHRVPAAGGALTRLTTVDTARGEVNHGPPLFLPGARTVVFGGFATRSRPEQWRLGILPLDTGGYTSFEGNGLIPLGLVDGQLVFGRAGGTIAAVAFDLRRRQFVGEPVPVLDGVLTQPWGNVIASLAANGSLVYMRGNDQRRLTLVDGSGQRSGGLAQPRSYASPRVSPDGRRVALEIGSGPGGVSEVWIYDVGSGVVTHLPVQAPAFQPAWTADGRRVVYIAERERRRELWWAPADGSEPEERLYALPDGETIGAMCLSPDGRHAVFIRYGRQPGGRSSEDLWVLPLGADRTARTPTPLLQTAFNERTPSVSPDGRWLAYVSDEAGSEQLEVYVRPFRGPGGRVQVSSGGGTEPVWARDGRRLHYRSGGHLMAAAVSVTSDAFAIARRDTLFEDQYRAYHGHTQYDVFPDGNRFVMLQPTGDEQEVVVVLHWAAELRERLAAAGRPRVR